MLYIHSFIIQPIQVVCLSVCCVYQDEDSLLTQIGSSSGDRTGTLSEPVTRLNYIVSLYIPRF